MERRLSAILAADVVGYTALMEADEARTFNRLRAGRKELFEPEIEKHHGRIFKLMGDGLLAEFGSVVDAVECAVMLQRGMVERNASVPEGERIQVRIGINLGEVIVEGEDRYGEGVNVAARLQQLADPGGICVSGKVSKEVEKKLAFGFESMGAQKVKNIAEPVAVYRVLVEDTTARRRTVRKQPARVQVWAMLAIAAVALTLAGIGVWHFYLREPGVKPSATLPSTATAGAPIVAVLPFSNMSSDATMSYFADGVTETLIAGLSRSPNLRVIARTSTDAYKGKALDIRQIAHELGAQYVVEGSVQKESDKMRIVAQLIDARSGEHIWAERYDREGSDALALQDDVTEKIIGSLGGTTGLVKKKQYELSWGKDSASLEEYDQYLRAHELFLRFTKEDTLQAIALDEAALLRFPDSALLRIQIAWCRYQLVYGGWSDNTESDIEKAFALTEQALAGTNLPPVAQADGHWLMAWLLMYREEYDRALREREITLELMPNDPVAIATMAELAIQAGRPDEAIASLSRDLMWDKNYIFSSPHYRLGFAYFVKGDYKTALEHLKREQNEDAILTLPWLAATYSELGMMDEARATVKRMRALNPAVSETLLRQLWNMRSKADTDRFIGALRKAGLPE